MSLQEEAALLPVSEAHRAPPAAFAISKAESEILLEIRLLAGNESDADVSQPLRAEQRLIDPDNGDHMRDFAVAPELLDHHRFWFDISHRADRDDIGLRRLLKRRLAVGDNL